MRGALLTGWGRTPASRAAAVVSGRAAQRAVASSRGPIIARGLGRAYGDAAQAAGGVVVDMTDRAAVLDLDVAAREISVEAGASLGDLMRLLVGRGLFVPVTPGTRQVTVGGAIAADVHGKNHHADGSFGAHVRSLRLLLASGDVVESQPGDELFEATVGGMGLTGIVLEARLALLPIASTKVLVDTERTSDLPDLLARMHEGDERYRYSVAWVDTATRRGVLTRGEHSPADGRPLRFAPRSPLGVPDLVPGGLLNHASVRAFNELWLRRHPALQRGRPQELAAFFHPLDGVGHWNRLYGPGGLVQYQLVVPFGQERLLEAAMERLEAARIGAFLAVLKRLGPERGLLSFPMAGWTLALDVPARARGLGPLLDELDDEVARAGGRIYLAKDSRAAPGVIRRMYPQLADWLAIRRRADPEGRFRSDLARRLELT